MKGFGSSRPGFNFKAFRPAVSGSKIWKVKIFIFFGFLFSSSSVLAQGQPLGEFSFSEFSLTVEQLSEEPGKNEFKLRDSFVKIQWSFDPRVSASLSLGTADLLMPVVWYPSPEKEVNVVEAHAKIKSESFDLEVGLFKIVSGFESYFSQKHALFPISKVKEKRWLIERDLGLKTIVEFEDFRTSLAVHNGEGVQSEDSKSWVTGNWSYVPREGFGFIFTAQVGGLSPSATSGSQAQSEQQFLFDADSAAKIRLVNLSVFQKWQNSYWVLEGGHGEILQNDSKYAFTWGRWDGVWSLGQQTSLLFRYEQLQSDLKQSETIKKYASLGWTWAQPSQLASVTLMATKAYETPEIQNDQWVILFRVGSITDP
jgi:hypothetical protein